MLKKVLIAIGVLVVVVLASAGGFVWTQVSAFDRSMERVYDVPVPAVTRSMDPAVIARGDHLAHSLAGCALADCHGADMGGGRALPMGPLGTVTAPNATLLAMAYSDGELARLIRHGVRRDGRSVRFMPVSDFAWLPDDDVLALVSWVRTLPAIARPNGEFHLGVLGKILDRRDLLALDVARHLDHGARPPVVAPAPTAEYGRLVAHLCVGCHGEGLSGGRIPGTPPSVPTPLNLTPDATGLRGWTFEDFQRAATTGVSRNGRRLNPFMPIEALSHMNETEMHALWVYLQSLPPRPFGER